MAEGVRGGDQTPGPHTPFSNALELASFAAGIDRDEIDDDDAGSSADIPEVGDGTPPPGFLEEVESHVIDLVGGPQAYAT